VEALDRQLRAGDKPETVRAEEVPRLLYRVAVLHPGFDEGKEGFHVSETGGGVGVQSFFEVSV